MASNNRARLLMGKRDPWGPHVLSRSKIYGYWDAAVPGRITSSAGAVSSWVDDISNINTAQATGASQPTLTNGWIYGDGIAKCLQLSPVPASIPTGTSAVWDWIVVDQNLPAATAGSPVIGGWGTNSTSTRRIVTREVVNGVNRASFRNGSDIVTNPTVDFSGKHVICAKASGTAIEMVVDGIGMTPLASVSNIGTASNIRHLASASTSASFFFPGGMAVRLITAPLSAAVEAQVLAYLTGRLLT